MVPDRTQVTIEAIVAKHVLPGSIFHTDGGAYYQRKDFWQNRGLIWVEHKKYTRDPDTGKVTIKCGGTNSIESFWAQLKRRIWAIYNTIPESSTEEFVLETVWRIERYSAVTTTKQDLHQILKSYFASLKV